MSKLLLDTRPLVVLPELACCIGLNEAIILQQVHYWLEVNKAAKRNFRDGHYWVYNSYREWQVQFPWWGERTVKRIFTALETMGLLVTGNYNALKLDRTKWYSINYEALELLVPLGQVGTMDQDTLARAIPETNITDTNNGNNGALSRTVHFNSPVSVAAPDGDIKAFTDWYYELYAYYKGEPHPMLKADQKKRVHDKLKDFADENGVDNEALCEMAKSFFICVPSSDHNINHFVSDGILAIRFYDAVY